MRQSWIVLGMMLVAAGTARGQVPEQKPLKTLQTDAARAPLAPNAVAPSDVVDVTPGDRAPDFQLDSSLGGTVRRADLLGHWSVLVFDESRARLGGVGAVGDSLRDLGVRPYGVCRDGVGALRTYCEREHVAFPLLSDPTGQISQLFGMYDGGRQAVRSGLVIVDARGMIRMVIQGPALDADDVLRMVRHTTLGG